MHVAKSCRITIQTMKANTRKILASTLGDPLEEGRTLFNKQVEETELEGKLKQRRRLLDLNSQGVMAQQVCCATVVVVVAIVFDVVVVVFTPAK